MILVLQGRIKERFVVINYDWFIPVQTLRRLHFSDELESTIFHSDSHWQLYIEHQSRPGLIRIGLVLLAPY